MRSGQSDEGLPVRGLADWLALLPAIGLLGLGLLFVAAPRLGAVLFGLPPPEESQATLAWLRALGLRDLAFGTYVLVLALCAGRRAAGLVLGVTVLIPLGDIVLVAAASGPGAWQLLLHAASGAYMAGAAFFLLRRSKGTRRPGPS